MTSDRTAARNALATRAGFTAPQKAALIIAALGPEAAGPIMERIGDKHLRAFAEAYSHLKAIPQSDLAAVIGEFLGHMEADGQTMRGGFAEAKALLDHFKGEEDAAKLLDDIDAPGGRTVWQKLDRTDAEALTRYLETQHAQAAAVILSRIDADKAADILGRLDPSAGQKILQRLARPMEVRKEALAMLAASIERDFLAPQRKAAKASSPGQAIGAMLNNLPEEKREKLLESMAAQSPELYEEVKSFIITFKDLPERAPPNAAPMIVREVETDVFLKAVKYGRQNAPEAVEYIFKNISQRMGQQYQEQIEALKPVTVAEAEACQAQIMTAVRRLVAAGEFELNKVATAEVDDEVYV